MRAMRSLGFVALVVLAFAVSASAQRPDARSLVLQDADVPRGYLFESPSSLALVPKTPAARRKAARVGVVAGYYAVYRDTSPPKWRTIASMVVVFTTRTKARTAVSRNRGPTSTRVRLGDEGWVTSSKDATGVEWRQGRIQARVVCEEMVGHRALALALARTQRPRIAAALR
jgi:hypothetical protein